MKLILETARLVVREFVESDAEAFHAFNGDPKVMEFTGEPLTESVAQARTMILAYPDYERHGYGRWALVYKPENRVIGFNGLKYLEELDEVDLGYRLHRDYWGRGLATESSLAILRYGFETLELDRIIGLVLPSNPASIRVLEKAGMRFEDMIEYCGERAQLWALEGRRGRIPTP